MHPCLTWAGVPTAPASGVHHAVPARNCRLRHFPLQAVSAAQGGCAASLPSKPACFSSSLGPPGFCSSAGLSPGNSASCGQAVSAAAALALQGGFGGLSQAAGASSGAPDSAPRSGGLAGGGYGSAGFGSGGLLDMGCLARGEDGGGGGGVLSGLGGLGGLGDCRALQPEMAAFLHPRQQQQAMRQVIRSAGFWDIIEQLPEDQFMLSC